MDREAASGVQALVSSAPDERAASLAEVRRKFEYINQSYRFARQMEATHPSFNESLKLLRKGTNPRARRAEVPRRLNPELELWVNLLWRQRQEKAGHDPDARSPTQSEIFDVCGELAKKLKPRRGRPPDRVLAHHVHGIMALIEQLSGSKVRAAKTRNGEYDPRMLSTGGNIISILFSWIDPKVTSTALADIVLAARASGEIEGKKFRDYFPAYGWTVDRATGLPNPAPGQRLESFRPIPPIYCS